MIRTQERLILLGTNVTDPSPEHKTFYQRLCDIILEGGHRSLDLYDADVFGSSGEDCANLYSCVEALIEKCDLFVSTEVSSIDGGMMLGIARRMRKPVVILKPKGEILRSSPPDQGVYFEIINFAARQDAEQGLKESLKRIFS